MEITDSLAEEAAAELETAMEDAGYQPAYDAGRLWQFVYEVRENARE